MTGEEAVVAVIDALESAGTAYMLVGSFSSNYYGVARSTQDADFVLQVERGGVSSVAESLGSRFHIDPQMSFETVTATTRFVVQPAQCAFQIEFFLLSGDPYDQERFRRRRRVSMLGRHTFVPTVEDVIVTKLRWSQAGSRAKDIEDIRGVIAVQGSRIDWEYVHHWCEQQGTRELLEGIRRGLPQGYSPSRPINRQ